MVASSVILRGLVSGGPIWPFLAACGSFLAVAQMLLSSPALAVCAEATKPRRVLPGPLCVSDMPCLQQPRLRTAQECEENRAVANLVTTGSEEEPFAAMLFPPAKSSSLLSLQIQTGHNPPGPISVQWDNPGELGPPRATYRR